MTRHVIIGAGPAGIAAGVRAAERGLKHTLFERSVLADTIVKYQKGKLVMAEPPQLREIQRRRKLPLSIHWNIWKP